jgi:hypothetical protein
LTSQVMMKMMKRTMGGVAGQAKCRNLSFETSGNTDHCSYDSLGTGCLFQKGACSLSLSVSQRISMLWLAVRLRVASYKLQPKTLVAWTMFLLSLPDFCWLFAFVFSLGCVYLCSHLSCTFDGWVLILDFYLQGFSS